MPRFSAFACARPRERASRRPSVSFFARSTSSNATLATTMSTITSDFMGVLPSSYPVNLIHLFTSGPQEAIIQVALKPDAPRGRTVARTAPRMLCIANCQTRRSRLKPATLFQPGDELRFAHPDRSGGAGHRVSRTITLTAQKIQAQLAKLDFLRDLQFAQEINYPTARHQHRSRIARDSSD